MRKSQISVLYCSEHMMQSGNWWGFKLRSFSFFSLPSDAQLIYSMFYELFPSFRESSVDQELLFNFKLIEVQKIWIHILLPTYAETIMCNNSLFFGSKSSPELRLRLNLTWQKGFGDINKNYCLRAICA